MSRDFWPSVFSWLQPILAHDKQFGFRRDVRSKRLINWTPRRISHRRVKILVLVYQTFFFKSFLSCNMCSPLNRQRFWFWLRCVQFDSPVGCTPRSQAPHYVSHHRVKCIKYLVFSHSLCLSTTFYKKRLKSKRFCKTVFELQYNFHINIFRHQREITFVKLWIKINTW